MRDEERAIKMREEGKRGEERRRKEQNLIN